MSQTLVVDLARNMLLTAAMVAAPMLVVALVVGLLISFVQAITQIQEQTLSFVPKLVAVAVVFIVALPWIMQIMMKYTIELFRSIPSMVS